MTKRQLRALLDRLLVTHSPPGDEREMEELVQSELEEAGVEVERDPHDNIVGKVPGISAEDAIHVLTHKDELGTIVRKIEEDGKIWLEPLGGAYAWAYGEGPMDLLGDEVVTGVLCVGSKHSSALSQRVHKAKTGPLNWDLCYIDCKLDRKALEKKGVTPGTRAVVARSRKQPLYLGDHVAGYGLDDKALMAVLLLAAQCVVREGPPPRDVYLVATSCEEVGVSGGAYATQELPGNVTVALDIAPVAEEYPIELDGRPVVLYKDTFIYHKGLSDHLCELADEIGVGHQRGLFRSMGTDASHATRYGHVGKAAALGIATENTHGYEITRLDAILNCAKLLSAFLLEDPPWEGAGAPRASRSRRRSGRRKGQAK